MVAFQRSDGSLQWRVDEESESLTDVQELMAVGDRLYATSTNGLHLLDPGDGRPIWTFPRRGLVAGRDGSRLIVFSNDDSSVWVLDPPK